MVLELPTLCTVLAMSLSMMSCRTQLFDAELKC